MNSTMRASAMHRMMSTPFDVLAVHSGFELEHGGISGSNLFGVPEASFDIVRAPRGASSPAKTTSAAWRYSFVIALPRCGVYTIGE